jgi:hypothetical protein
MRNRALLFLILIFLCTHKAHASTLGQVRGVVHDPQHHPIRGAHVVLSASLSAQTFAATTGDDGTFALPSVPLGDYTLAVTSPGFREARQPFTLASNTSPELHIELQIESVQQSTTVTAMQTSPDSVTPISLVSRREIEQTPGADRGSSLAMITDFVPGAYMTHDMLHMRGGHQVSWLIDGVQIPNTNIGSNLGAQIDPRDIDYLEAQRGSYTADNGDRSYGVFNIVPRSGFGLYDEADLTATFGSFLQTDDHLDFGGHTEKSAHYISLNGTRTDYGLSTPSTTVAHDAANAFGGLVSLLSNRTPTDQLRLVAQLRSDFFQIPFDPDPNSYQNQQVPSFDLRDTQRENDALVAFTWNKTFSDSKALEVSPFYHFNSANYESRPGEMPVATTSERSSNYAGLQLTGRAHLPRNNLQAGLYGWGQHDSVLLGVRFNDFSGTNFSTPGSASGGLLEPYVSDSFRAAPWLTLTGGLRSSTFFATTGETVVAPRAGVAVLVPRLHWVLRAFYGRFYQPPPLLSAEGPVVQFATANNSAFVPLHGERDEEHQFGIQIPLHGWLLDADTFKTRANNFLDHANIGESNIYYPVTIDGALIQAWELTLHSPREWRRFGTHLAYSNQTAKQRGAITGGLICSPTPASPCDADFTYRALDHDQRNTLNAGANADLRWGVFASADLSYGSGFTNGLPDPPSPYTGAYLPAHTTFDLSAGKHFGPNLSVSLSALNVANRRVLLDNSLTFGGFHQMDPRQIYAQVRYRFHY